MLDSNLPFCADLDRGQLVGGFPHGYDAQIIGFEDATAAHRIQQIRMFSERASIVRDIKMRPDRPMNVRISLPDGTTRQQRFMGQWCNDSESCLFTTPLPTVLGLRVRGIALALDVTDPESLQELPARPLTASASGFAENMLYLSSDLQVFAFDGRRIVWETRRLSLDGIDAIHYRDGWIIGAGLDVGGASLPFHIDATTGIAEGGFLGFNIVYPAPDDTQDPKQ
jgi:hypothetical protein